MLERRPLKEQPRQSPVDLRFKTFVLRLEDLIPQVNKELSFFLLWHILSKMLINSIFVVAVAV